MLVRPARRDDVAAMSRVLSASITQLCAADHHDDPDALAAWTRNKSVEGVTAMLDNPNLEMQVVERDGAVIAVGAVTHDGSVALNYVSPQARFTGASTLLLTQLEASLKALGHAEGRLEGTQTAMDFYLRRGWLPDGPQAVGRKVNGYPMRKVL
ncbi:GNAT family N-acetyltransferase [Devosia sp. 2618]|uniref:GNAT family N-acetyltransferase n=1 Tax=Devosia sp. 2618 TaxID=3156454 RepID=UPI00339A7B15